MNLNHRTFEKYKNQIEIETSKKLISRGESHVTVITPVEFWNILRPQGMTIEQINQLALKEKIQSTHYEEVCLGIGSAQSEETYFVVIRSPGLLRLRKLIQSKLKEPSKFAPHHFYPHITIGFTQKDLHESDGVIKDEKSCFKPLD